MWDKLSTRERQHKTCMSFDSWHAVYDPLVVNVGMWEGGIDRAAAKDQRLQKIAISESQSFVSRICYWDTGTCSSVRIRYFEEKNHDLGPK